MSQTQPVTILYVDDEPALLELGKRFLELNQDWTVLTCTSAPDAIARLKIEQFDAIISDYQMPEMDGIGFLQHLRGEGNEIPFIIFTGKGREEVAIEALNSGADFYIQKGGDPKSQFAVLTSKVMYAIARKRNETALHESEERYRNVVEDMDEFICRFLPDGTIIFVNDAFCRHFGESRDELIGSRFRPTIHPDDLGKVDSLYAGLTPENPSGILEQRVIMPDGTILWQRWSTRGFYDKNGDVREYQSVGRDITELMERDREQRRLNDELMAANEQLQAAEEELRHQLDEISAAQEEVIRSEAAYRTIFEYTNTPTIIINEDTTIALANSAFEQLAGSPAEELRGRSWTGFVSKHDQDRMRRYHAERRSPNQSPPRTYEFTFISSDGNPHPILVTVGLIPGTRQSVASLHDISERVRIEEAFRRSEEQYRMIAENMTETITVMDRFLRCTYVSPSIQQLRGFSVEEGIGQTLDEVLTEQSKQIALARFNEEINSRRDDSLHSFSLDLEVICRDGSTIWTNNTIRLLYDDDKNLDTVLIVSRDITDQKTAETALMESELFNRRLIENLPDYILIYDEDGRILQINNTAVTALGYAADEMIGSHVLTYVVEKDADLVIQNLATRREGKDIPAYEIDLRQKSGTIVTVIVKGATIRHSDRDATLLVLSDITDRKAAEEALYNANRRLKLLSGVTRHDIMNKLTVIRGYLALCSDEMDQAEKHAYMQKVQEAVLEIGQYIELSKQYEQLGTGDRKWLRVSSLLPENLPETLTLQDDADGLFVYAEPVFHKVFANLLDNTARHGEHATRIHLYFEPDDADCRIIWEDDGSGIPNEQKDQIFERGFGKNTGFGLFLSREILMISGISIRETGTYGEGARFEMLIPEGSWKIEDDRG